MYGLKKEGGGPDAEPTQFDLEKEFEDPATFRKIKDRVETRIQELKKILRSGESKEEYDQFGVLLHAYAALQKLMARAAEKK